MQPRSDSNGSVVNLLASGAFGPGFLFGLIAKLKEKFMLQPRYPLARLKSAPGYVLSECGLLYIYRPEL